MQTHLRKTPAAFTLIELMVVITIIVILAGLVLIGLGFTAEKQARSKAQLQLELIGKGLEEFKSDTGSYPATSNSSDAASAANSQLIYEKLFYEGYLNSIAATLDPTKARKIYLPELDPRSSKQGWVDPVDPTAAPPAIATIKDPWARPYAYRTAKNPAGAANPLTINPEFELWSWGKDGKTNTPVPTDPVNRDDVGR